MAQPQLIREEHGVRLTFHDVPPERASGTGGPHYRIATLRRAQAVVRASRAEAEACFAREIEASRRDPLVARILAAGL
jgi:hypothetical protein